MKKLPSLIVALALSSTPVQANDPGSLPTALDWKTANRGSISVEAKDTMAGRINQNNFKTDYGSYNRDQLRVRRVGINVRNFSRTPSKVAVEALWFVAPERPPKDRVSQDLLYIGDRKLIAEQELRAGQSIALETESSAKSNRTRYEALGESYASGVKFAGWVVVVRNAEKVLSYKASTPALQRLIETPPGTGMNDALASYAKDSSSSE